MVLGPRDAADTRSSLSAVFQVGGLQVICADEATSISDFVLSVSEI